MKGIKKLITNVALPASLFISMSSISVEIEHLWITLAVCAMLFASYFVGLIILKLKLCRTEIMPFYATGYSFGFLGLPLFAMVFGQANAGQIGVLGIGHELFVWVIYYALLQMKYLGVVSEKSNFIGLVKNPVVIGLVSGLLFNLLTVGKVPDGVLYESMMSCLQFVANIVTPLILICIGYDLQFEKQYVAKGIALVLWRLFITGVVSFLFKVFVFDRFYASPLFDEAFFTLIIMPPLFSLPIFLGDSGKYEDERIVNAATVLNTVVSIFCFTGYVLIHAIG
jgi:Predicted permeases